MGIVGNDWYKVTANFAHSPGDAFSLDMSDVNGGAGMAVMAPMAPDKLHAYLTENPGHIAAQTFSVPTDNHGALYALTIYVKSAEGTAILTAGPMVEESLPTKYIKTKGNVVPLPGPVNLVPDFPLHKPMTMTASEHGRTNLLLWSDRFSDPTTLKALTS
ncbi:MAG: hypothetical protein ACKO0Z_09725 [Betaproteobacteria bacterium]